MAGVAGAGKALAIVAVSSACGGLLGCAWLDGTDTEPVHRMPTLEVRDSADYSVAILGELCEDIRTGEDLSPAAFLRLCDAIENGGEYEAELCAAAAVDIALRTEGATDKHRAMLAAACDRRGFSMFAGEIREASKRRALLRKWEASK